MKWWDEAITITSGCTKVSPACLHCWAETNHNLRMRQHKRYDHDFSEVKVHPENMDLLLKGKNKVFSVWNDAFHEAVSDEVLTELFLTFRRSVMQKRGHRLLICTKRIERVATHFERHWDSKEFNAFFPGIYIGTTVENQEMADKRIPELLKCRPFKLFLSVEPLLAPIMIPLSILKEISYVIVGCESGHHARETKLEWIEDLRDQCIVAGVPLWVKQIRKLPPKGIGSYYKHKNGKMVYDYQPLSTIKKEDLWK